MSVAQRHAAQYDDDGSPARNSVKFLAATDADPDGIGLGYAYDPADYDPDALHGFFFHRARKAHLGLTWDEYLNEQAPAGAGEGPGVDPEAVAAAVRDAVGDVEGGGDVDTEALVSRIVDDLAADVRQAAYTGAKEAIQDSSGNQW